MDFFPKKQSSMKILQSLNHVSIHPTTKENQILQVLYVFEILDSGTLLKESTLNQKLMTLYSTF